MNKFQYWLGWIALVGAPTWIIAFVILSVTGEEGWQYVLPKLIWVPFVALWGLKQVRTYRYLSKLEAKHDNG